jgi:aminoglycoside phosphotransferase family enzyme/predicted kinase
MAPGRAGQLTAALARPEFYPHEPAGVEVRETHGSWVFLAGERAYKLKKPLVLPFLDYGTAERRREMCREEVRLNRRLAPDVYLGVRSVAATPAGLELASERDPRAVDYLVEMRRYDERSTMAALLERGELRPGDVRSVGRLLARFHAGARRVDFAGAPAVALARVLTENLRELIAAVDDHAEIRRVLELERFTHRFLEAHAATLDSRGLRGRTREGHGDLRAEHVVLGDRVRVVDCVEFDRGLRELDVADDLAFLVMDLIAKGGARHAEPLVSAYREAGGDPGDDALIAFYAVHRALVRAKVALTRAAQEPAASAARGHHSAHARDLVLLAERLSWQARLPLVIVVCGLPASGKTRLAEVLAATSGLAHLSSDVTRKRLAGLPAGARAADEVYSDEFSALTYAELGRRAAAETALRRGAIVDATFRHRADRDAFATAFGAAAPMLFVECRAPVAVLRRRAADRERLQGQVSDATLEVVTREASSWEQLDEVDPESHLTLRSDRSVDDLAADVRCLLDRRLARPAT